jgi:hypothetical protein
VERTTRKHREFILVQVECMWILAIPTAVGTAVAMTDITGATVNIRIIVAVMAAITAATIIGMTPATTITIPVDLRDIAITITTSLATMITIKPVIGTTIITKLLRLA